MDADGCGGMDKAGWLDGWKDGRMVAMVVVATVVICAGGDGGGDD